MKRNTLQLPVSDTGCRTLNSILIEGESVDEPQYYGYRDEYTRITLLSDGIEYTVLIPDVSDKNADTIYSLRYIRVVGRIGRDDYGDVVIFAEAVEQKETK